MTIFSPLDSVYSSRDSSLSSAPFSKVKRDCVFMFGPFKAVGCVRTPFCFGSGRAPTPQETSGEVA